MYSLMYSALFSEDDPADFAPRVSAQEEGENNPAYFQLWIDRQMSVCISITDEQRRQLLDVLSSAPPLPKSDAQIDAEAAFAAGESAMFEHQERNAAVMGEAVNQGSLGIHDPDEAQR